MIRGYLELLRPANVATALADVLAGVAVAGERNPHVIGTLLVATACLYAGGIVLNDVFDRALDAVERPERPIPSGRVPAAHAAWLGGLLLAVGILVAAQANATAAWVAIAIGASVLAYDALTKKTVAGPVNMGACRGLNLLLGVAAVPAALSFAWPLGLIGLTYITAVTIVSRGEVAGGARVAANAAMMLLAAALISLFALSLGGSRVSWLGAALAIVLTWRTLPAFWQAGRDLTPGSARKAVRTGVLSLVLVDAVIAAAYADMIYCLAVLSTALLAWWLARAFAVT